MSALHAYRPGDTAAGWSRIDLLLSLFDAALDRLDRIELLRSDGDLAAIPTHLTRVQYIIGHLVAGVRVDINKEQGINMLRLYEYCLHELRRPDGAGAANARRILATLRDGFDAIREEARTLERSGQVPSVDQTRIVLASA